MTIQIGDRIPDATLNHFKDGVQALSIGALRAHRAETAIELTATRKVARWLTLQPDMQYVRHPGWGATPDALVLGLRLRFTAH